MNTASRSSQHSKILIVAPGDPWSVWTISGITRGLCQELHKRGLLYGAIGVNGDRKSVSCEPQSDWTGFLRQQFRRILGSGASVTWDHEAEGHIGDALKNCPENTTVLYCFVTPRYESSLKVRRFRFMDLALSDAVKTGGYGFQNLSDLELERKRREQILSLEGAEGIVTLSSYAADAISKDYSYSREKITPIGAGPAVPLSCAAGDNFERYGRQRILFLGRAWERKGGPLLLDAFRLLKRQMPGATLVVAGPSACPSSESGVEYYPPIDKGTRRGRRQIEELYNSASVFCMPSECETWGLVYVEASQRRLPIVGFHDWALPDIVRHGETGLLGAERSASVLAELLNQALSNPLSLQQMGIAAEQRVRGVLDWPHVVDRLLSRVLPEALNGREPVWLTEEAQTR